jgi:hypothetical protein
MRRVEVSKQAVGYAHERHDRVHDGRKHGILHCTVGNAQALAKPVHKGGQPLQSRRPLLQPRALLLRWGVPLRALGRAQIDIERLHHSQWPRLNTV